MKLVIISSTRHFLKNGKYYGWGSTVREIDTLSQMFDEIVHLAPLFESSPSEADRPYASEKVSVQGFTPTGGKSFISKIWILCHFPEYLFKILKCLKLADAVHVRCPSNIGLIAIITLMFLKFPRKRWVKYGGNWDPAAKKQPWSYCFQRWFLLLNGCRAKVSINGSWPDQEKHLCSFYNPSFSQAELEKAEMYIKSKKMTSPFRIVYVGALNKNKNPLKTIHIFHAMIHAGMDADLDIAGNGPLAPAAKAWVKSHNIETRVTFHGWQGKEDLGKIYTKAHFIFMTSRTEGWPKVLSEAMAYGVVPLSDAIGCIPQHLESFQTGQIIRNDKIEAWQDIIKNYLDNPQQWSLESRKCLEAAKKFTYENYIQSVSSLLDIE